MSDLIADLLGDAATGAITMTEDARASRRMALFLWSISLGWLCATAWLGYTAATESASWAWLLAAPTAALAWASFRRGRQIWRMRDAAKEAT